MKVGNKIGDDSKYDTKIPEMGRREVEISKKALRLLREDDNVIFRRFCLRRDFGRKNEE